jgi:hypothetical protein
MATEKEQAFSGNLDSRVCWAESLERLTETRFGSAGAVASITDDHFFAICPSIDTRSTPDRRLLLCLLWKIVPSFACGSGGKSLKLQNYLYIKEKTYAEEHCID